MPRTNKVPPIRAGRHGRGAVNNVHWSMFGLSFLMGLSFTLVLLARPVQRHIAAAVRENRPQWPTTTATAVDGLFTADGAADDQFATTKVAPLPAVKNAVAKHEPTTTHIPAVLESLPEELAAKDAFAAVKAEPAEGASAAKDPVGAAPPADAAPTVKVPVEQEPPPRRPVFEDPFAAANAAVSEELFTTKAPVDDESTKTDIPVEDGAPAEGTSPPADAVPTTQIPVEQEPPPRRRVFEDPFAAANAAARDLLSKPQDSAPDLFSATPIPEEPEGLPESDERESEPPADELAPADSAAGEEPLSDGAAIDSEELVAEEPAVREEFFAAAPVEDESGAAGVPVAEEPVAEVVFVVEPVSLGEAPDADEPVAEEPAVREEFFTTAPVAEEPASAEVPVAEEEPAPEPVVEPEPSADDQAAAEGPVAEELSVREEFFTTAPTQTESATHGSTDQKSSTTDVHADAEEPKSQTVDADELPTTAIPVPTDAPKARVSLLARLLRKKAPPADDSPTTKIPVADDAPTVRIPVVKQPPAKKIPAKRTPPAKKTPPARGRPVQKVPPVKGVPGKKPPPARLWPEKKIAAATGAPAKKAPPAKDVPTKKIRKLPYEPFGPGSARATVNGGGPAGWLVKGRTDTRLYYTPDDPPYELTVAQVWFKDERSAARALFTPWSKSSKKR
ncbi:channel accessory protein ArfC, sunset domain variant [Mycobacterium sp. 050134]|uniref:channel accessory protein ArfC, sunset domain variant n=1 Tax=Mycobacterium sp. 050134 TaxID=3096111 RepID=UPI002ED91B48